MNVVTWTGAGLVAWFVIALAVGIVGGKMMAVAEDREG